ncbi:MAG TPA: hypothetical protein VFS31_04490 [Chitinophagaceae bacterium]|nr:hypothetical protein [Chitinophagaceae bacterium]
MKSRIGMDPMVTKLFTHPVQALNARSAREKRQVPSHAVDGMRLGMTRSMMKKEIQDEEPAVHLGKMLVLNIKYCLEIYDY